MSPVMHRHGGVDWPDASACALCKEQDALIERDAEIARLKQEQALYEFNTREWRADRDRLAAENSRLWALLNKAANALGPGNEGLCGEICALLGEEKTT